MKNRCFDVQNFEEQLNQALMRLFLHSNLHAPRNLADAIRYSLLAPGKRIRPRLTFAAGKMLQLPEAAVLSSAIALEMIHCFTLIHDDLPCMDNDDFRRGKPSNHKVYGEALALLAGDALIPMALEIFLEAQSFIQPEFFYTGLKRFLRVIGPLGVIGGQAAESLMSEQSHLTDLQAMHALKTGALFEAAILIPKDLVGIASEHAQILDEFAHHLGLAFQVADDLEDLKKDRKMSGLFPHTSILHYLSEEEARKVTLKKLTQSKNALLDFWKEDAVTLAKIAEEVEKNLL